MDVMAVSGNDTDGKEGWAVFTWDDGVRKGMDGVANEKCEDDGGGSDSSGNDGCSDEEDDSSDVDGATFGGDNGPGVGVSDDAGFDAECNGHGDDALFIDEVEDADVRAAADDDNEVNSKDDSEDSDDDKNISIDDDDDGDDDDADCGSDCECNDDGDDIDGNVVGDTAGDDILDNETTNNDDNGDDDVNGKCNNDGDDTGGNTVDDGRGDGNKDSDGDDNEADDDRDVFSGDVGISEYDSGVEVNVDVVVGSDGYCDNFGLDDDGVSDGDWGGSEEGDKVD